MEKSKRDVDKWDSRKRTKRLKTSDPAGNKNKNYRYRLLYTCKSVFINTHNRINSDYVCFI